jgi:hypothetical protein
MANQSIFDIDISEILELECEIYEYLNKTSSCFIHFEYSIEKSNEEICDKVKIITYNKLHRKSFLFKEFTGKGKIDVLKKALIYIKNIIRTENNYTVHWINKTTNAKHLSYFRGIDEKEVKDKFYCSIDNIQNIKIDEITLSPVS